MRLTKLRSGIVPLFALLALGVGMAGCSGDDGNDGTDGTNGLPGATGATGATGETGATGPAGPGAKIEPRESCGVCHSDGSAYGVKEVHALAPKIAVSGIAFAVSGADLLVTFNVKQDGVNATDFDRLSTRTSGGVTTPTAYRLHDGPDTDTDGDGPDTDTDRNMRSQFALADVALSGGSSGNYTITITNGAAIAAVNARYLFRIENAAAVRAMVVGDYPLAPDESLVSEAGCSSCHSTMGNGFHYGTPVSGKNCTVCHDATNTTYPRLINIGHGIHNSHNMPGGEYDLQTTTASRTWTFSATYPTYMTNCSVCHTAASGALAKVNEMPVTGENCLSCHGSMEYWDFAAEGLGFHEAYTEATNCQSCHNSTPGAAAPDKVVVRDFHDGLETERVGIIFGGEDVSVTEGAKFTWQITKVVDNKATGKLEISWTATYPTAGTPVDPCNATASATAPVFFNMATFPANEGGLSMLRSYAQGDDYILGQSTSAPGQALAVNVTTANTTCAANVATTLITRDNMPDGTRGVVAIQGKPLLPVPVGMSNEHWEYSTMYVRVPSPTYEYAVGTGDPVTPRRAIADTKQCLGCHVGSLYQHGNNRVDNVSLCIICHNSASSDQSNRVLMGVTASEAYDGKVGQTFEFKTLLHAIHSAGQGLAPIVIYRTRGIYAWAADKAMLPNWPATTDPTLVYGGDPAVPQATQVHNFYSPTYPRLVNDCSACHVANFDTVPDQDTAVATTIDAGAAPWQNKIDDSLQGASAAACTSCHSSTDAKGHAYQNGWTPQTFENGRQTILDTK